MARRSLMIGTMWVFVALALVGGVVIGAVLPLWQRAALQNDVKVLEKRLADKQKAADDAQAEVDKLNERIASLEASTQELEALNSQLTSQVASLQAAQAAAPAPAAGSTKKSTTTTTEGAPTIVERSVTPSTVAPGASVTLLVKTRGDADRVTMRIDGPSGSSYDYTFSLKKVGTEGDVAVWRSILKAPSGAGQYRCIAAASNGSRRTTAAAIPLTIQ